MPQDSTSSIVNPDEGRQILSIDSEWFDILVAEDDPVARELISSIFEVAGWPLPTYACDGVEALKHLEDRRWDILITDLNMPRMGGEDLVREAVRLQPHLTIVVVTGNGSIEGAVSLMRTGAHDFLMKPYSVQNLLASIRRAKERVLDKHEFRGMREVVNALLAALESKDKYLEGHAGRVSDFAVELGRVLGLDRDSLKVLELGGLLHDVGKIGIHEDILNKTGPLTPEEYEEMKKHPVMSRDILAPVAFLEPCLPAVLHHHERIDGRGYPHGIAGDEIPLEARIISVVDAFDAMTSARSYRKAMPVEKVIEIIEEVAGTQLDADISRVFLENLSEITQLSAVECTEA